MNYRKPLIIFGIILLLSGCSEFMMICSLNPFYLEKNIVLQPEIEGKWIARPIYLNMDKNNSTEPKWSKADTTLFWQIKRFVSVEKRSIKPGKDSTVYEPKNFYLVELTKPNSDTVQYQFYLYLFRIKGNLFGDFSPREISAIEQSRITKENFFRVHTLARIKTGNGGLSMSWLGVDYMKNMIEQKRVRVKYRYVPDAKRLLLTASSEDLTEMLERYADQTRFIDWDKQPAMLRFTQIK